MNNMHRAKDRKLAISKSDAAYRALKRAILDQTLAVGKKLPEDSISESLGVSRTIVRQALARLTGEGLIELQPHRGACVAQPSLEESRDIFAVRRVLEAQVVEILSDKITPQKIKILETHVDIEDKVGTSNSATAIQLAGEFHVLLAGLTENSLLIRYVTELVSRSSLILSLYGRPHSSECGVSEHREIIAALQAGDRDRVRELMLHHIDAIATRALLKPASGGAIPDILAAYAREEGL